MKKEQFESAIKECREIISAQNERIEQIKKEYIEANKPCDIGQMVKVTRKNGRVTIGEVKGFGILQDKHVYVTAIKPPEKSAQVYISEPYAEIELL